MVASGALNQRDRFHLINGILVTKLTKKPPHAIGCERVRDALIGIALPEWRVTTEAPIRIPAYNEPEPDIAVVKGSAEGEEFEVRHPEPADVALIVEVANTSLSEDREVIHVYGAAGIPISWIVNLAGKKGISPIPKAPIGESEGLRIGTYPLFRHELTPVSFLVGRFYPAGASALSRLEENHVATIPPTRPASRAKRQ